MEKKELPLGLGMALAQNENAMRRFEALGEEEKQAVIDRARAVSSKREMESLVSGLADDDAPRFF
jgi:2,3-bisphosphoglycerate-independent phosphoglycerate mutase